MSWKSAVKDSGNGYYTLHTQEIGSVPVRLFLTPNLLDQVEESIYPQIVNAASFPGVKLVAITPDVHHGYGVPIGTVLLTDADTGAVAMGPVGFDVGCGMMSASSEVPVSAATPENRLRFNREVTRRVALGPGKVSHTRLKSLTQMQFEAIIRGGAAYYAQHYGERVDRTRAERDRLPVDDSWQPPWGGEGRPERGVPQLGTLGGGNHFIELQGNIGSDTLYVQMHSGSRGFGHGLATNYFRKAKEENPAIKALDLGYFTPESTHYRDYLNAVAAGGNFAIVNRLAMFEQIAIAFWDVFGRPLSLVYEISHNLVQREHHPEFGWV
ncbi:MAG: RtcB family protein, partial [Chloroflexi bacterium]